MLSINGTPYRLVNMDTNICSDVVKEPGDIKRGFLALFADGCHAPCFTVYSLVELRRTPWIYNRFIDLFDAIPCLLLKNEDMLFADERDSYPHHASDPTLIGFSVLNTSKGTNLRNVLEVADKDPAIVRRQQDWPRMQQEILDAWMQMRPNFKPRGARFTPFDGLDFVNRVTLQQVRDRDPDWFEAMEASGPRIDPAAFPSIRMTAWTAFFRLYLLHRRPEVQDVFDAVISAPTPYVDAVVTEKCQANIYRQCSRFEPRLQAVDVFTLKDLRAADSSA